MAKKHDQKVIEAALKSEDGGYIDRLAEQYYYGRGREKSVKTALRLWERACDLGNADALYYRGVCLYYGDGLARDTDAAFRAWEKAAARGHEAANISLSTFRGGQNTIEP